jgi:hypothetical protein
MKKPAKRAANGAAENSAVEAVFRAYPKPVKVKSLALRRLIFDTAKATGQESVAARSSDCDWSVIGAWCFHAAPWPKE